MKKKWYVPIILVAAVAFALLACDDNESESEWYDYPTGSPSKTSTRSLKSEVKKTATPVAPTDTATVDAPTVYAEVFPPGLNLRSGPSTDYEILQTLRKEDQLEILAKAPDGIWMKAVAPDGSGGWVHSEYITAMSEWVLDQLPVVEPPATPSPVPTRRPTATPKPAADWRRWFYQGDAAAGVSATDRRSQIGMWEAKRGHEYVSVGVQYANRGKSGTVHCNPFSFRLITADGVIYSHEWLAQLEPDLQAVDLAPGGKTRGWVTFQVPSGSHNLQVLWDPPSLFASTVYIPLR